MYDRFDSLIDALNVSNDERAIKNALQNFTNKFGFARFAYPCGHVQ